MELVNTTYVRPSSSICNSTQCFPWTARLSNFRHALTIISRLNNSEIWILSPSRPVSSFAKSLNFFIALHFLPQVVNMSRHRVMVTICVLDPPLCRCNFSKCLVFADSPMLQKVHCFFQVLLDAFRRPFPHKYVAWEVAIAEKIDTMRYRKQLALTQLQFQCVLQIFRQPCANPSQFFFIE